MQLGGNPHSLFLGNFDRACQQACALLLRLFHDESGRVFRTHSLEARCRCSRERIARILRSFPEEDIEDMRKDKVTKVTCDFCNTSYEFTGRELAPGTAA